MANAVMGMPNPEGTGKFLDVEQRPPTSASSGLSVYAERDANWPALPKSVALSSAVGIGVSVDLTFTTINTGKIGYLDGILLSSTGLVEWTIKNGVGTLALVVTERGSFMYRPPNKTYNKTLAADAFVASALNLDSGALSAYATAFWDEY